MFCDPWTADVSSLLLYNIVNISFIASLFHMSMNNMFKD